MTIRSNRQRMLLKWLDFCRLGKLMSLTTSDYDQETLLAIRQANDMVRESGSSWPELLLRILDGALKEQEKSPDSELSAQEVLEQTLRWLHDNGKISEGEHANLLQMVRAMFRSKDTNFWRRGSRRVREIMRKMKVSMVGSGAPGEPPPGVAR